MAEAYGTFERGERPREEEVESLVEEHHARLQHEHRWIAKLRVVLGVALGLMALNVIYHAIAQTPELPPSGAGDVKPDSVRSVLVFPGDNVNGSSASSVYAKFSPGVLTPPGGSGGQTRPDAWATFNDSLHEIGWSQLWIQTSTLLPEEEQDPELAHQRRLQILFAAGYAEGSLTHRKIDEHYVNVYQALFPNAAKGDAGELAVVANVGRFLLENLEWMRAQIADRSSSPDAADALYWKDMATLVAQFDGLVAGYQAYSESDTPLSELDLFMLNAGGDMEDLISIASADDQVKLAPVTQSLYTFIKKLKCSALIRILPGFRDLVWGHATWDSYNVMNRIFKHIELPAPSSSSTAAPAANNRRKVSMSSFPGYLTSVDDWYMTDAGLGVMETTNGVFDPSLYALVTPESVLCWLRSSIANLVATDGETWAATFSKYNSGTYNNQWMVVDTKRFVVGEGFQDNGLTVLEQLPGAIHVEDLSNAINQLGFWASYNVPYFPSIYARSGYLNAYLYSHDSESWSHENCSRALQFKRDAPAIDSLADLKRVMRFNDWVSDPLSEGHASHAIAARFDLETELSLRTMDGAVDAKVTSLEWAGRLECEAVSGPTDAQNPVFEWTEATSAMGSHVGHPQRFDFAFERMAHAFPTLVDSK